MPVSLYEPMHSTPTAVMPKSLTFLLPNMFSKAPTSEPSDLLTDIFSASLYSPDGIILASRS